MSISLIERSIFLHFINREIQFVQAGTLNPDTHSVFIKACGLMTTGCLAAPFAQVHELYSKQKNLNRLVSQLAENRKLCLYSGLPDYPTFMESRQSLYADRRDRYSAYFADASEHRSVYMPSLSLNTTGFIKSAILSAVSPYPLPSNIFSQEEIERLRRQSDFIRGEFVEKAHAATFSLYENQNISPKPQETRFFGQVSCRLFVNHYADTHDLIIPTGVFADSLLENYDHFPLFDIPLQILLLEKLGLANVLRDSEFHQRALNIMFDLDFLSFCRKREELLRILMLVAGAKNRAPSAVSLALIPLLNNLEFDSRRMPGPVNALRMVQKIEDALRVAYLNDRRYTAAREELQINMPDITKILLLTATPLEAQIFRSLVPVTGYQSLGATGFPELTAVAYRKRERIELWHVQSLAGSAGLSGSARTAEIAMKEIRPKFVFSVGVAFGLNSNKQKLGDVLVAESIDMYEKVKIDAGKYERRGDVIPCASEAVSFAGAYSPLDEAFNVFVGPVFSGEKLVNDLAFCEHLRTLNPKAIGGEMEGAGIIIACEAQRPRFTLIKGICDFGANKGDSRQEDAARNAFRLFFDMVDSFQLAGTFTRV